MKVYKFEIVVIDHDNMGSNEIIQVIKNTRYPNRCISPKVLSSMERDIGEWSDDHPLNSVREGSEAADRLFSEFKNIPEVFMEDGPMCHECFAQRKKTPAFWMNMKGQFYCRGCAGL